MSDTLKFPAGEWTHQDFADVNGKTKPSVYNQLQSALKTGTVVKGGMKTGKGKPSQLYKVADGNTPVVIPPTVATVTVTVPPPQKIDEKIDEKPVETVEKPAEPVVVATVTETPKITVFTPTIPTDTRTSKSVCPVCKQPLTVWDDATGVMVKCLQPITVCSSSENPFGHGSNEKNAVETLNEKWAFCMKGSKE